MNTRTEKKAKNEMNPEHLWLLKAGMTVWNSQRPWIESLSDQKLQRRYQQYIEDLRELEGIFYDDRSLEPMSLEDYRETLREGAADLRGAELWGIDLHRYDLRFCDLRGAKLNGADLRDSLLVHADLSRAHLIGADLRGANLEKARLYDASLHGALVEQKSLDAAKGRIPDYQKQNLTGPFTGLPSLSLDEWAAIVQGYQKRCAYCGGPYEVIDHVLPLREGGVTWRGNVVPACFVCANARSDPRTRDKVIPAEVMERIAAELKRRAQSAQE